MSDLPHRCRCGIRWGGLKTAHCPTCHLTSTTVANFDRHRRDGKCIDPPDVGLVDAGRTYKCWGMPGREKEQQ